jgi:hypothetical protein
VESVKKIIVAEEHFIGYFDEAVEYTPHIPVSLNGLVTY